MKFFSKILTISCALILLSCGGDDDICLSGEATPRAKIKFKLASNDKEVQLDSLFIDVEYANGNIKNIINATKVDSVFIPLRVDESAFTKMYVKTRKKGDSSVININYTTESTYVSPACGYKLSYKDVTYQLEKAEPVKNVQSNQNEIINEDKTHFFLLF